MKPILFTLLLSTLATPVAFAQDGHANGFVGNLTRLSAWLETKGPDQLDFAADFTATDYREHMKQAIAETKIEYTADHLYLGDDPHEVVCLADQTDAKKLRCNQTLATQLMDDALTNNLHATFAQIAGLPGAEAITSQLSDFMPDDGSSALSETRVKSDEFLSKKEKAEVLSEIDLTAGDTWAEGEYNYHFPKVTCSRQHSTCKVTVQQLNRIYSGKDDENERETLRKTKVCKIKRVTGYSSIINSWGIDLRDDFYDQLNDCINRMDPPPPRVQVDFLSDRQANKIMKALTTRFVDFWSKPSDAEKYPVSFLSLSCPKQIANFCTLYFEVANPATSQYRLHDFGTCQFSNKLLQPAKLTKTVIDSVQTCLQTQKDKNLSE